MLVVVLLCIDVYSRCLIYFFQTHSCNIMIQNFRFFRAWFWIIMGHALVWWNSARLQITHLYTIFCILKWFQWIIKRKKCKNSKDHHSWRAWEKDQKVCFRRISSRRRNSKFVLKFKCIRYVSVFHAHFLPVVTQNAVGRCTEMLSCFH